MLVVTITAMCSHVHISEYSGHTLLCLWYQSLLCVLMYISGSTLDIHCSACGINHCSVFTCTYQEVLWTYIAMLMVSITAVCSRVHIRKYSGLTLLCSWYQSLQYVHMYISGSTLDIHCSACGINHCSVFTCTYQGVLLYALYWIYPFLNWWTEKHTKKTMLILLLKLALVAS